MKITDAHCHICPDRIAEYATQNTQKFYDIPRSAYIGDVGSLLKQCEESGVSRCVVSMVAKNPRQTEDIRKFIGEQVALHPDNFIGLGALHPDSTQKEQDITNLMESGLKGIKLHPDIQGFKADCDGYKEIYELCTQFDLPILLHTGDSRFDNSNPDRIEKILKEFPHTRIIGAHFGGWSLWQEAADKLYKYDNFYVDTCSSFYSLSDTDAKKIINKYGTEKVIFGTDYPVWKQEDEINKIISLGFTDDDLENIFHKNIEKVLKIV
jgi:predicted TIM-barrel fold metal-dependent hydrolase